MIRQGIFLDVAFSSELEKLYHELKKATIEISKIEYWNFIGAKTYEETIKRAYLVSFLVTYGYATLEIHPFQDRIFIKPFENPISKGEEKPFSFPISLTFEEWKLWRKTRKT